VRFQDEGRLEPIEEVSSASFYERLAEIDSRCLEEQCTNSADLLVRGEEEELGAEM
jgi:hypothetical protein